jgi:hypothetical protein
MVNNLYISDNFKSVLYNINNELSLDLKNCEFNDIDISKLKYNYIDVEEEEEDKVSFIPTNKLSDITNNPEKKYKVINNERYLTHSDTNDNMFEKLGYDKTKYSSPISYSCGDEGVILNKSKSSVSENVYALFKFDNGDLVVLNKASVVEINEFKFYKNKIRNKIKIGKVIRNILMASGKTVKDKALEDFVNEYKAIINIRKDIMKRFDIVKGDDIKKFYNYKSYYGHNDDYDGGVLNQSCMKDVNPNYFNIYSENDNVSMLILYDKNGHMVDGKYISEKIIGRALLWNAVDDNGEQVLFMDRIYVNKDSHFILFEKWAENNNYHRKVYQNYKTKEDLYFKGKVSSKNISVKLKRNHYNFFPFLDTLAYCELHNDCIILRNYLSDEFDEEKDCVLKCHLGDSFSLERYQDEYE